MFDAVPATGMKVGDFMFLLLITFLCAYSAFVLDAAMLGLAWMIGGWAIEEKEEYDHGAYILERAIIFPLLIYRWVKYDSIYGKNRERR